MDLDAMVQMGFTAAVGAVLLYTMTRPAVPQQPPSTKKDGDEIKYEAPAGLKKHSEAVPHQVHHETVAKAAAVAIAETPVKPRVDHDKTHNESAIVREMHVPTETPSWMSSTDPSFVAEFANEDIHPTWMASGSKPITRTASNGSHRNGVDEDFVPSWLSHREPSFTMEEMQPTWMTQRPSSAEPVAHAEPVHTATPVVTPAAHAHSQPPQSEKVVNKGFVEDEHVIEPSWMSTRDVQEPAWAQDFSWMTRKDPTPALKYKASARTPSKEHRVVACTNNVVSHMARDHSDMVFVYPVASSGYLGEVLKREEPHHPHCQIQLVETRAGAGRVVVGSATSSKKRVSVLCSSRSLRQMIPAISEMAEKSLPVTFHVALSAVSDEDVSSRTDHSDLSAIRDIENIVILFSSNPQDSYEMAITAHWISKRLSRPVFHVFDSTGRLNRIADVELSLRGKENPVAHSPENECALKVSARALRSVRKGPFEYTGSSTARVVIVAMGAAAQAAERHIHEHGSAASIGCVRVRLLRPWSADELIKVIPATALRICVLDQSQNDSLFADVASSFASDNTRRHVQVSYVHVPPSFRGVTFELVGRAFEELMLSNDERIVLSTAAAQANKKTTSSGASSSSLSKSMCVFMSSKHVDAARIAGTEVAKHLARDKVRFACYTDDFAGETGGISLLELRFASDSAAAGSFDAPIEANQAQVVLICDQECLNAQQVDVFGPLREGGTVLLPHDVTLSLAMKRRASAKQARLVHLGSEVGPAGFSAISAGLDTLSKADFDQVLPHLLAAFRSAHHDSMDWNLLNEACRKLERGHRQHVPSSPMMNGNGVGHDSHHVNGKANGHQHYPRRLGDLFQTASLDSSFNDRALDTSQNGLSEFSTFSLTMSDSTVFGLIPRIAFSRQPRDALVKEASLNDSQLEIVRPHEIAWNVVFKEAYGTDAALRPREHDTHQVRLVCRKRLTPIEYDRNIFHLEFDISGTDLKYEIGDALGVFGHNDVKEVDHFISHYNATGGSIDSDAFIAFKNAEKHQGKAELVSVRNLFIQHLDLFGRPSKKFYVWLAAHAKSRYEHLKLLHTGTDDAEGFKLGVNETLTFADILLQHPSARPSVEQLASVIPAIKARHYSIASSMRYTPRSVSLLIVQVDWKTPTGKLRYGQCTRYLANLDIDDEAGCFVTVDVVPSVLRLPPRPEQPIVMSGLGTGMAPFRAFVQERKVQKESGMKVGPIVLYFGARHRSEEWLYGEEWDQYHREGLVTRLGLAFSRDQKEKIYIQHRIREDADLLKELFMNQEGYFYLCGPTWPVPDVRDAVAMGLDPENAKKGNTDIVERLKEEGRYILEVY